MANLNKHVIREGFGVTSLLSPEEIALARSIARRYKFEVDKKEFDKAKLDFRTTDTVEDSFAWNYIANTKTMVVLTKEELQEEAKLALVIADDK